MPIRTPYPVNLISEDEFHDIDYQVMGLAFAVHNEMGRLWNETIFRAELADRCSKAGFKNVQQEAPIEISYQDFVKTLYVDLFLDHCALYELKAVQKLTGKHFQQALTYLFLLGLQHGKLVNMRSASVKFQFVSTRFTFENRLDFFVDDRHWQEIDEDCVWLKKLMIALLQDWGAYLDTSLFYEAIAHFRGGEANVVKEIEIKKGGATLGRQKIHMLNPKTAFKISAMTKDQENYEKHIRRFMSFTPLQAVQWINFNYHNIEFKTIRR